MFRRLLGSARRPLVSHAWLVLLLSVLTGCATSWEREALYYRHAPRTVLVVPPANQTTAVEAGGFVMATVAKPLIDRGYYVFPVEATLAILRQEGIDEGAAWQVPPQRFAQYFGADAVLYITIHSWDSTYVVIASDVAVSMSYRLTDTRTGDTIWEDHAQKVATSHIAASRDPLASLIVSAVDAAVTAAFTQYIDLAAQAHAEVFARLLPGVYHPDYPAIQEQIAAWRQRQVDSKK